MLLFLKREEKEESLSWTQLQIKYLKQQMKDLSYENTF